jgi:hypothetical protein
LQAASLLKNVTATLTVAMFVGEAFVLNVQLFLLHWVLLFASNLRLSFASADVHDFEWIKRAHSFARLSGVLGAPSTGFYRQFCKSKPADD